jgi:hypothetical protein
LPDSLDATIDLPAGQTDPAAFRVTLRITNRTGRPVAILNPDMGVPAPSMDWPLSLETYRTSLLLSFGFLELAVSDENGNDLPLQSIQTWATPGVPPDVILEPGAAIEIPIPIGEFFALSPGTTYRIAITYGDRDRKVAARTMARVR